MNWQPIETAPKDGTRLLLVDDEGEMEVASFAWLPVRLDDGSIAWLTRLERTIDDNPVEYLGLFEVVAYRKNKGPFGPG